MPPKTCGGGYTEEDVMNALFDISDNGLSLRKAASKHNVPSCTLSGRGKGLHTSKGDPEAQTNNRVSTALFYASQS
jgi:hypothetical protein